MKFRTALWLVSALALTACGNKAQEQQTNEPVRVKEITAGGATAAAGYNYSGTVEEENATPLSFTMGGTITSLSVNVGDRVRKGQLIATVDPTSARNSHDMALATLRQAEDAHKRMKQLHDKGSLPDIQWVEAESKLAQAQAAEKLAQKNLDDCRLYAPAAGVVAEKSAEVGQNAAPGLPVVKIVTAQVLNVKVSVPEQEIASVALNSPAEISVPALHGKHYQARVKEKGVVADPLSRSYTVKLRVEKPDAALLPGMVTEVSIARAAQDAQIVIPTQLLQLADDNSYFVYLDKGGKAVRCKVECREFTAAGALISAGLSNGDRVITEGRQKVYDGCNVKCID